MIEDKSADRVDLLNIGTTPAIQDSVFLHPERIRYDHRCFQLEGKDTFIFSGTFHYFRVPQPLWADRFRKLKRQVLIVWKHTFPGIGMNVQCRVPLMMNHK